MNEPKNPADLFVSIGPILKDLIIKSGYDIPKYSEMVGMDVSFLNEILEGRDIPWSVLNRIIRPLGYHFVLQKIHLNTPRHHALKHLKKPKIVIKQVKFKGKPQKIE